MPLLARERKVSFSPHKSHLEKFFFRKVCSQVTQYHHGTFVKTMLQNRLPKSRHQKSSKINVPLFLSKQPTTERLKARKSQKQEESFLMMQKYFLFFYLVLDFPTGQSICPNNIFIVRSSSLGNNIFLLVCGRGGGTLF